MSEQQVTLAMVYELLKSVKSTTEGHSKQLKTLDKKMETFDKKLETFDKKLETFDKKLQTLETKMNKSQEVFSGMKLIQTLICMGCAFPVDNGIFGRRFDAKDYKKEFDAFNKQRKKDYASAWKEHSGLKRVTKNSEQVEIDLVTFCERQFPNATKITSRPSSASTSKSPGTATFAAGFPNANLNTVVVFEVTTSNIAFNKQATPYTEEVKSNEKNHTTGNLLEKLLQLESNLLFVTMYYGISIDQVMCGLALPGKELKDLASCQRRVKDAIKHRQFSACIPLIAKAWELNQFLVVN
jgi:hypothetical protein